MRFSLRRASGMVALLALPVTVACGGGGGGGGNSDLTATLPIVVDARTGTLTEVPEVFSLAAYGEAVGVGDDFAFGDDYETRGILTFSLASLPPGALISKAIVRLSGRVSSGNPYAVHGNPYVDHIFVAGVPLSSAHFGGATIATKFALFPTFTSATFQPGEFDASLAVRYAFENGLPEVAFRLYFSDSPEANALDDLVHIQVSTTDPSLQPFVVVTYR